MNPKLSESLLLFLTNSADQFELRIKYYKKIPGSVTIQTCLSNIHRIISKISKESFFCARNLKISKFATECQ